MLAVVLAAGVVALVPAAPAAAEPPVLLGTLVGPSQAAMYPSGTEVDRVNDRLVVADTGRDRILIYSFTGTLLDEFGEYGTADGQLASPRDVAVDGAGNIYVADAENNRIQKFNSAGDWQWTRGGLANGAQTLNTPIGVTWDSQHNLLLSTSTGQSLIKAWDTAGGLVWTSPSGNDLGAHGMRDVSRGPDGRLWVTAYKEHQIKVYDTTGLNGRITTTDTTPVWTLGDGVVGGHGDNQLNFPYNVVFSADGNTVYVSDTGNGRIARWDISGAQPQWLAPWGGKCTVHPQPCADPSTGQDQGKYNHLRRVAIDEDGNVYGADFWGSGFWVFSPTGQVLRAIEGDSAPAPGVAEPHAVDVNPATGQVYVMDRLNHRIEQFQPDGTYVRKVGARAGADAKATFSWPEGLTVAPNGEVWAIDTRNDQLDRFPSDLSTGTVPRYGSTGTGAQNLNYPSNADVDSSGVVWVVDTRNHRIQKLNPTTGTFSSVGSQGSGAGQLQDPMGIAVTASAVYVADTGNDRVQKFALDGSFLAEYTGLDGPEGIDVAPDGTVWVADTQNSRLVHLSAGLADLGDGFGSQGSGDLQFFNPHDLAFGNDKMYVADTYNNRVQVFSMPGPVDPPPTPLTPEYVDQISDDGGVAPFYPAGVEIVDGTWYVADSGGSRVITVDPATGAVTPVAESGLNDPRDLELDAADPTALWVTDTGGSKIVRLSRTGQQLGTVGTGSLNQPYGLANDATRVYVANTYGSPASVKAFNRDGSLAWNKSDGCGTPFSRPRDVGLADNGQIAVADTDNHRIVILNAADGSCVSSFGGNGTGAGKFKSPRSVTADGSGGLWVADAFNYRVQHLTMAGATIGTAMPVGTVGDGATQFRSPHCVTPVPGTTEVAVCDTFNFRIPVYDGSGTTPTYDRTVGGTKPTNGGFNGAFAVAYGPDGSLYVADWFNHRIQKFDADGDYVRQWGGYGSGNGGLIFPRGILVSPSGEVVVTDSENNRIDVFNANGDYQRAVKPKTGLALSRPHQTALDGTGGYWIADTNNSRIIHLDSDGDVVGTPTTVAGKPEGIAVDTDGTVLVSNTQNNRVERYTANGVLVGPVVGSTQVNKPGGLLVTGTGDERRLWIASAGNDRVVVVDVDGQIETFGTSGGGEGQLEQPRGVAFDPTREKIAVADFGNNRVSLWDPFGDPPPADTVDPTVAFTAPSSGASLPAGTVAVTGTAGDNTSVSAVEVAVQRPGGQWLQANGTWGGTQQYVAATLDTPGGGSTGWTLSFSATTAGSYTMTARATDQAGNDGTATRGFSVTPPDTTAPGTTIATPATNAVLAPPTITATGSATDNVGVASVTILVKDRDSGLWLQTNGTWGSTAGSAGRLATLANPGATSTGWTIDVPLGAGNYLITARARDAAGNQTATAAQKQFAVRVSDTVAPDGTITTPANNATFPMGPVSMTGNATDNLGVDQVLLAIQDTVTKMYLRANGTWTTQYGTITATVTNRGATSTGWTYTFTPPVGKKYAVTAIARDAAGNQDATKPRNVFTVQ
ncbi:SMP-30/gluconolactonase/LRE family protein [Nocardioides sp. SR21]|uniref:SMP-30/gluconolactonase/LRE family protein n=1 Tax=Nocardioides sp. SR21 TaxID=2919501 RepID=UPI001FA9655A|nr:SMP-30/gluconolactonase/LRE family protein [Nocardioides sp. SR21]